MLQQIKRYYKLGFYKLKHIDRLLELGKITKEEYEEIVKQTEQEEVIEDER